MTLSAGRNVSELSSTGIEMELREDVREFVDDNPPLLKVRGDPMLRIRRFKPAVAAIGVLLLGLVGWMAASRQFERERVDSLRAASIPVRTIDPVDDRFEDLLPLAQIIGQRRFVLMTETDHEDKTVFDARTRLIRFLHQKMGFDVVSIEASYVTMWGLHDAMRIKAGYAEFIRRNPTLHTLIWQRPLLDYIHSTQTGGQRSIALIGHHVYYNDDTDLLEKLRRLSGAMSPQPFTRTQADHFDAILKPLITGSGPFPVGSVSSQDATDFESLVSVLTKHVQDQRETLSKTFSSDELSRFEALVGSLPAFVTSMTMHNPHDIRLDRDQLNKRDKAMAGLIVNASHGPLSHRKMVILSASAHLLAGMGGDFSGKAGVASMGDNLRDVFGAEQVYTIVFEAYSGKTGKYPGNPIREASPRSVAGLLHKVGDPYRFLDLSQLPKDHWLRRTRIGTRATAYYLPDGRPVILPEICDAVFYIDELRPMR